MADKFRYKLGKVLDLRERKEDKTKKDKAVAERERDRERDALDELKTRLSASQKAVGNSLANGQTANVQMGNDYSAALEKKIAEQEKRLKEAEIRLVDLEKAVTLATRDVKILEKHKDKSKERWQVEENKKEAKNLDEMAVQGYLKREKRRLEDEAEEARYQEQATGAPESSWIAGLMASAESEAMRRARRQP